MAIRDRETHRPLSTLSKWAARLGNTPTRSRVKSPPTFHPRLEPLEDRRLLSVGPQPEPLEIEASPPPSLQSVLDTILAEKVDYKNHEQTKANPTAEIHGQKWHDRNGDGIRDPGDVGLDGWTIELVDPADDTVVDTTVTTSIDLNQDGTIDPKTEAGLYSFTGLAPGSYEIREVVQDGWRQAFPLTVPTGELSFVQVLRDGQGGVDGLDSAQSVTVSPDGNHVYTASYLEDAVSVFSRDGATGQLNFVQTLRDGLSGVDGLDGANSVVVSPDGNHVYVTGGSDDAVAVFSRDGVSGQLNFAQMLRDGQDGVDGLDGASSVTISPDGNHVYAASYNDDAVVVFSRDGATGQLNFVQLLRDGQDGVDGLNGANSVTVSLDGKHVYATGVYDSAVAVFSRDGATGQLNFVQILRDGQGGVDGLYLVTSVTVSPDGNHVYAVSEHDDAVVVFSRNRATGQLNSVQVLRDGQGDVDGLDGAHSVTVSPDGNHVYVASGNDDAVAVFGRDLATGRLNFVQMFRDGQGGVDGLNHAQSVTFSPDGNHVYVAGGYDEAVTVFSRIFVAGPYQMALSPDEILTGLDFGNYRKASVSGQKFEDLNINGVRDVGEPGLNGWSIELVDSATGTVIDTQVTASVDLDENGTIDPETEAGLYSFDGLAPGSYEVREVVGEGYLQTYPSPPTYSLTLESGDEVAAIDFGNAKYGSISGQKFEDLNANGVHDAGEPGLDGWTIELVDPATGTVLDAQVTTSVDLGGDSLIDPETETGLYSFESLLPGSYEIREILTAGWVQTLPNPSPYFIELAYGQELAVQDFGNWAIPSEIHGQKWHDLNGDSIRDPGDIGLDGWTIELVDTTDGSVVATAVTTSVDTNEDGTIDPETETGLYSFTDLAEGDYEIREVTRVGWGEAFPLTVATNKLRFVQEFRNGYGGVIGLNRPRSVTTSPDGKHVYAVSDYDDALVVYSRDETTGRLDFVQKLRDGQEGVNGLDGVTSVTVSPDGNHLYAASRDDNAVAVFRRDRATGELNLVQTFSSWNLLEGATSVAISPDGKHVYVAAAEDDAVSVFSRDAVTGQLTFVHGRFDGYGRVDGLDGAESVTVSPDGRHVYVAGYDDDAVAVFSRNEDTGWLTFVQVLRDGSGDIDGLWLVRSVTVSPDGEHVYAASSGDSAVAVFNRNGATGRLDFVQILRNGQDGVDGLSGADSVTVSPDGNRVYVASFWGDAVVVFSRDDDTGRLNFVQMLRDGHGGVDGLAGAQSVTVSPDGNHIYAAAAYDNSVTLFEHVFAVGPYRVSLSPGEILTGMDFGNYQEASISGQKFEDLNGDGVRDAGEPGMDGWTIELVDSATGTVIDTQVTAEIDLDGSGTIDPETETGLYAFDDVAPGSYEVREVVGEEYLQTFPSPPTYSLTLLSGDLVAAIDFGNFDDVSISGQAFEDFNGNGIHDAGEPGLDGWRIELVDPTTGTVLDTQVTSSIGYGTIDPETEMGFYSFEGLLPGSYKVREVLQTGWVQVPSSSSFELAYGQDVAGQDFGNRAFPGEIHGQKWQDLNGDGDRGADEPGLDGWTIELVDPADDSVVATAVTASIDLDGDGSIDPQTEAGLYSFTGLAWGSYEVREVVRPGWVQQSPLTDATLTFVQRLRDGSYGIDGLWGANSVTVSPDGNHVYATGSRDDAVAVFSRDGATGQLNFVQVLRDGWGADGLRSVCSVTVSPDGSNVYTASLFGGVAAFSRDEATGRLTFVQVLRDGQDGIDGLGVVREVTVSPDGKHVYTASSSDDAIAVFSRDRDTGRLSFVQVLRDGQDGVEGLDYAWSVTVSPDGNSVYAAGPSDDAVAVFSRDEATGRLSFVQVLRDGWDGVDGLAGVSSVTVSPDGNNVYAAGRSDHAVAVFSRDGATGQLTFVQILRDDRDGVDGLYWVGSVTVSPDGKHVYTTSANDDAIVEFSRDGVTGRLTFMQMLRDMQSGLLLFNALRSVTLSPDGKHVYTARSSTFSSSDHSVAVFSRDLGAGPHQTFLDPDVILTGLDFGDYQEGSISGRMFEDFNANGARDVGEPGLNGWTIELVDPVTGQVIDTRVTIDVDLDEDGTIDPETETGLYSFDNLAPGNYQIRQSVSEGDVPSYPPTYSLTLVSGSVVAAVDFGNRLPQVVGRHVFYNDSAFDGNLPELELADDGAIATDKRALLIGEVATFANYTNYDKGINGVMVDLLTFTDTDLLDPAEDFEFRVGNGPDLDSWSTAPEPIGWTVRKGEGVDGSDRVTFVWADSAIEKQWLRVTVRATARTGLPVRDVFYFGNAPGEAGDQVFNTIVNATDEIVARNYSHSVVDPAAIDDSYDYNRDGLVNGTDQIIARNNQTNPLTMLRLIIGLPVMGELIVNGGFETGDFSGWVATNNGRVELTPWTVGPAGGGFFFDSSPVQGTYSAYNGFDGAAGLSYELYQDVYLPADAQDTTLTTNHRIVYTGGSAEGQDRTLTISVRDTDSNLLELLHETRIVAEILPETDLGWTTLSFDLSAYAGQTVRIHFAEDVPDDYAGPAMVEFDAISLIATAPGGDGKGARAVDLVLGQAAVDWQYEFEVMQSKRSVSKRRNNIEATVDWLLAAGIE